MKKEEFGQKMRIIFEDRGLGEPSSEWLKILFDSVSKLDDSLIRSGFQKILKISSDDWNKNYGYRGKPTIFEFIEILSGKTAISKDIIAQVEVNMILHEAQYPFSNFEFKNKTTIALIRSFRNGLKTIHFDLYDVDNPNKKDSSFYKKDLVKQWLYLDEIDNLNLVNKDNLKIDGAAKKLLPKFKKPTDI